MCFPGSQISPARLYYLVSAPWICTGSLTSSRLPRRRESGPLRVPPRSVQAERILRLPAFGLPLLALLLVPLLPVRAQNPDAKEWLTRYGYLPPADPVHAQMQSLEKLQDAIKVMQRFAGLPETGQMGTIFYWGRVHQSFLAAAFLMTASTLLSSSCFLLAHPMTIKTMRKPRCSLPDVLGAAGLVRRRRRYSLSGSVWKKRTLTWSIRSFSQKSQLSPQIVRTLLSYALAVWATESGLTFQEVNSQYQEPDIIIHFARAYHQDSYPFDGSGGTLAHAFFPGEHPISGDTHFDDEETWTFGSTDDNGIDLFAVAVHEFGHALGLGHSSAPNSIMRPFYQGPVGDPATYRLPQDDRDGLQQLYGRVSQNPNASPHRFGSEP